MLFRSRRTPRRDRPRQHEWILPAQSSNPEGNGGQDLQGRGPQVRFVLSCCEAVLAGSWRDSPVRRFPGFSQEELAACFERSGRLSDITVDVGSSELEGSCADWSRTPPGRDVDDAQVSDFDGLPVPTLKLFEQ